MSKGTNTAVQLDAASTAVKKTPQIIVGKVVSNKMNKTIVVIVERKFPHARYGKFICRSTRYYAHDESNSCAIGDLVAIRFSRPLSKMKRWVLERIVESHSFS